MKVIKSYKFRLYPDEEQFAMLLQHGGNTRFTWNKLLEFQNNYHKKSNKYPNQSLLQKKVIELKKEFDFLKLSHSQPIQVTAQRLVRTTSNAFEPEKVQERNKKIAIARNEVNPEKREKKILKAMNYAFPNFKSKHDCSDSIFYPQNFKIRKSKIFFAKLGWIKFKKHRKIEGISKFVTIKQEGNQWYVSVSCEINIKEREIKKDNIIGIDLGIKTFAVFSDGNEVANPKHLEKHERNIKIKQRRLNNKTKWSNGYNKQKGKVQKAHRKVKNVRNDFLHKTTHHMINKYDGFILEKLDIRGMLQDNKKKHKKTQNKNTSDVSWFEFKRILGYKSLWNFKYFEEIDQYEPSTKTCSNCGNVKPMTLANRTYICPICGLVMDRDYNASLNIIQMSKLNKTLITTASVGTGKNACGGSSLEDSMKQEKLIQFCN